MRRSRVAGSGRSGGTSGRRRFGTSAGVGKEVGGARCFWMRRFQRNFEAKNFKASRNLLLPGPDSFVVSIDSPLAVSDLGCPCLPPHPRRSQWPISDPVTGGKTDPPRPPTPVAHGSPSNRRWALAAPSAALVLRLDFHSSRLIVVISPSPRFQHVLLDMSASKSVCTWHQNHDNYAVTMVYTTDAWSRVVFGIEA